MAMTAATPMIMPSMVSAVRILLRLSALMATRKIMNSRIMDSAPSRPGRGGLGGDFRLRPPLSALPFASGGGSAASSSLAHRRCALISSRTMCPSRNAIVRVPYSAMSCSCVMSRIVMPRSMLRRWNTSITSMLVRLSRLPVGSSASRMDGSLMSARAMATRCCWPPDSWFGWWCDRSRRPTISSAARARLWRSDALMWSRL